MVVEHWPHSLPAFSPCRSSGPAGTAFCVSLDIMEMSRVILRLQVSGSPDLARWHRRSSFSVCHCHCLPLPRHAKPHSLAAATIPPSDSMPFFFPSLPKAHKAPVGSPLAFSSFPQVWAEQQLHLNHTAPLSTGFVGAGPYFLCLCTAISLSRGMLAWTYWSRGSGGSGCQHSLIPPLLPPYSPLSDFFLFSRSEMVLNSSFPLSFPFEPLTVSAYSCLSPQKYIC